MNKSPLSEKIISLRKSKGFSQEQLADLAGINLRTLQRIENGETEPRGQTLRLIAQALNVPLEEFLDFIKEEDPGFLQLMNLSTLAFWVIPLGNIFLPLACWVMKKNQVKGVGELGRRIINFQFTWSLITYGLLLIAIGSAFLHLPGVSPLLPLLAMAGIGLMYVLNSIFIIIAAVQLQHGAEKIYELSLKIIH